MSTYQRAARHEDRAEVVLEIVDELIHDEAAPTVLAAYATIALAHATLAQSLRLRILDPRSDRG